MGKYVDEMKSIIEKFEKGEKVEWKNAKGEMETIEPSFDNMISNAKKEIEENESRLKVFDMNKIKDYQKLSKRVEELKSELAGITDENEKAKKEEEIGIVENLFEPVKKYEQDAKMAEPITSKIEEAKARIEQYEASKKTTYMQDAKVRVSKNIYFTETKEKYEAEFMKIKSLATQYKMDMIRVKGKIASAEDEATKNQYEQELETITKNYEKLLENAEDLKEAMKMCDDQKAALYENEKDSKKEDKAEEDKDSKKEEKAEGDKDSKKEEKAEEEKAEEEKAEEEKEEEEKAEEEKAEEEKEEEEKEKDSDKEEEEQESSRNVPVSTPRRRIIRGFFSVIAKPFVSIGRFIRNKFKREQTDSNLGVNTVNRMQNALNQRLEASQDVKDATTRAGQEAGMKQVEPQNRQQSQDRGERE